MSSTNKQSTVQKSVAFSRWVGWGCRCLLGQHAAVKEPEMFNMDKICPNFELNSLIVKMNYDACSNL